MMLMVTPTVSGMPRGKTRVTRAAVHPNVPAVADVIVVGTDPAESSIVYHVAILGFNVILLKRQELGWDKIYGDGLTPSAMHKLISVGVDTTGW